MGERVRKRAVPAAARLGWVVRLAGRRQARVVPVGRVGRVRARPLVRGRSGAVAAAGESVGRVGSGRRFATRGLPVGGMERFAVERRRGDVVGGGAFPSGGFWRGLVGAAGVGRKSFRPAAESGRMRRGSAVGRVSGVSARLV
ncbi:hypothetical protein, partial [Acidomonas methanolica]